MNTEIRSALTPEQRNKQRAERLRAAVEIVEEVAASLNGNRHRCGACGIDVLEDKSDGRKLDTLLGIVERLERMAGSFALEAGL